MRPSRAAARRDQLHRAFFGRRARECPPREDVGLAMSRAASPTRPRPAPSANTGTQDRAGDLQRVRLTS